MLKPKASPASGFGHTTGERGLNRNWSCACQPGILGPPVSPLPVLLQVTLEQLCKNSPTSWKLSSDKLLTKLDLNWTLNSEQPSSPQQIIPPALLTAIASFRSGQPSWTLQQSHDLLSCSLTWPTSSAPAPASPSSPTSFNDSGFSSPLSSPDHHAKPLSPDLSPVRRNLSTALNSSTQTSTEISKPRKDAATSTTAVNTSDSYTLTTTPPTSSVSIQTSTPTSKTHKDAVTSTAAVATSDSSTLTSTSPTSSVSVQTSTPPPSTSKDASTTADLSFLNTATSTQTTPSTCCSSSTQTSPKQQPTRLTTSTSTQTSPPANLTTSTSAKNKKKKKHKQTLSPCTDAETQYNPPPHSYHHCRLCHEPNYHEDSYALSHLLTCLELPPRLLNYRTAFFKQQSQKTGIPLDSLQTQTALFLTTHTIEEPDPTASSLKNHLIGQLLVNAMDEFEQVESYHAALSKFVRQLIPNTMKHLHLDSTANVDKIFYTPGVDHLPDDETEHLSPLDHLYDTLDMLNMDEAVHDDDEIYDDEDFTYEEY